MADVNSPQAPRRALAAERRRKAVALRITGATYEQIGRELGISAQSSYTSVRKALAKVREDTDGKANELRKIELQRLDAAQASIWPRVVQGDNLSIDRFLRISKRRGEITGMDAPAKQDITTGGEKIKGYAIFSPDDWDQKDGQEQTDSTIPAPTVADSAPEG